MRAINLALYLEDFNRYPAIRQLPLQPARDVASILLPGRINGKGTAGSLAPPQQLRANLRPLVNSRTMRERN